MILVFCPLILKFMFFFFLSVFRSKKNKFCLHELDGILFALNHLTLCPRSQLTFLFISFKELLICNVSDISRRIFIAVYWHGHPNSGTQKMNYTFIYFIILHHRLCFFLLNLSKVYFQVRKLNFSIVNHTTDHHHFNVELLCALQPL